MEKEEYRLSDGVMYAEHDRHIRCNMLTFF